MRLQYGTISLKFFKSGRTGIVTFIAAEVDAWQIQLSIYQYYHYNLIQTTVPKLN